MTPGYILSADGTPFEDQHAAAMQHDMLARELGEAFKLVEHPTGGWTVVRGADAALQATPESAHPTEPVPIAEAVQGAMPEGPGDVLAGARSAGPARPEGHCNTEAAVGVERRLCSAGEHKGRLDMSSALDSDDRARMCQVLDRVHAEFIEADTASCGERLAETPEVVFCGDFRVGEERVELGLAEDLYTLASAFDRVGGACPRDFTPRRSLMERLSDRTAVHVSGLLADSPAPDVPALVQGEIRG